MLEEQHQYQVSSEMIHQMSMTLSAVFDFNSRFFLLRIDFIQNLPDYLLFAESNSLMHLLFLGYVIAATGALSYINHLNSRNVHIEVFDPTNTAVTCKNLTNITARLGSTGGFVQNKILICGGWSYRFLPLYVV